MSRRLFAGATVLTCGACLLFCRLVDVKATPAPVTDGQDRGGAGGKHTPSGARQSSGSGAFGATRVWQIHLDIPAAEFEAMQPAPGGFGAPGAPPGPPVPEKQKDRRDGEKNLFGTVFPWAH